MLPALVVESRDLEKVYAKLAVKPWERRFTTLTCRASYQVEPRGAYIWPTPLYCGNGLRLWSTVPEVGNPASGSLNPAATAPAEVMVEVSSERFAATVRSPRPYLCSTSGLTAL